MACFAVLPCAGRSRRMGAAKLLLPWGQTTLIEHVLSVWKRSPVERVVVVVRPDDPMLAEVCRGAGVDVVVPGEPPAEMKDSVRLALERIAASASPKAGDAWFLAPADTPRVRVESIEALAAAHDLSAGAILAPTHQGRRGHPVLFPWTLAEEVAQLGPDEGVNQLLKRHGVRELPVEDPGVLIDVDTPEDYRASQM